MGTSSQFTYHRYLPVGTAWYQWARTLREGTIYALWTPLPFHYVNQQFHYSSTNTIAKKCRRLGEIHCTTLILLLAQQMRMTLTKAQLKGCSRCVSSNQLLHHNVQGEGEALDLVTCLKWNLTYILNSCVMWYLYCCLYLNLKFAVWWGGYSRKMLAPAWTFQLFYVRKWFSFFVNLAYTLIVRNISAMQNQNCP